MWHMIFVWARIIALAAGWLAALLTAGLANWLLDVPFLADFFAIGTLWSCLLLLE